MSNGTDVSSNAHVCKRCKSKLITGIKCKNCGSVFHPSCAKISPNVKYSNDKNYVICCEITDNVEADTAFYDAMDELAAVDKKVETHIYPYIIKQKDILIKELNEKVNILLTQIDLLTKINTIEGKGCNCNDNKVQIKDLPVKTFKQNIESSHKNTTKTVQDKKFDKTAGTRNSGVVEPQQISAEILKTATQLKCSEIINLTNDVQLPSNKIDRMNSKSNQQDAQWQEVTHTRNNRRRQLVVGNNEKLNVRGVPKLMCLHVTRIGIGTTINDLQTMLTKPFPEVKCEELTARNPSIYSSFKVSIYQDNFKRAMDPSLWPQGACISRYFFRKKNVDRRKN